jgi:hypothetical protein
MPSRESSQNNIQKAIASCMLKGAIRRATELKKYLLDGRISVQLNQCLKELGIEIKINEAKK